MRSMLRRVVCGAALTTLVGVCGAGMAAAQPTSPLVSGKSATPPSVRGEHFTRYCVSNYQPNSTVTVDNTSTGVSRTITTNVQGKGCTSVPVTPGHCDAISAHGANASGSATTHSSSTVCVEALAVSRSSGSTLPFTGSNDVIPMTVLGGVLVLFGGGLVLLARRRRSGALAA